MRKKIIKEAYELFDGDRKEMAAFLGISKTNLFEKIHKYGIEEETLCISQKKVKDRISNIFGEMGIYYYDLVDDSSFLLAIVMCSPSMGIAKICGHD